MGFDEQQLLMQLCHMNLINRKGFILCHHSPVNRIAPHLRASPRHATPSARRGEASESARVWFTDLLLPASQVVYTESTL